MCLLAVPVGRFLVKLSVLVLFLSCPACVLIRRQFGSFFTLLVLAPREEVVPERLDSPPATTDAQERVKGREAEKESSCV
jgi:hypothetical protein